MAEWSIVGAGNLLCSGRCAYCSATSVQDIDYKGKNLKKEDFGKIIFDWDNLYKTMSTNPIIQEHLKTGKVLTLNWWAAEPLDFYHEAETYFDWVHEKFPTLKFRTFISTNAIPLARKNVVEWLYKINEKYGLDLQISHDGVGQFVRTKTFDPFYDPKTKDVIVKLAKDGIFNMINVTLNNYNCSPLANFQYIQKWRYENHLENLNFYIKLNHNNDSAYTKGYRLKGENLRRYIHELEQLFMESYVASPDNIYWKPFKSYFENQMKRFEFFKGLGGCGQFSSGQKDWSWAANTKGEYVFCQLCSDPETVINAKCEQAKACEHCEFRNYDECHPCPDMEMSEDCEYKKEFIRLTLRMKTFISIVDGLRSQLNGNKSCGCNNKGKC